MSKNYRMTKRSLQHPRRKRKGPIFFACANQLPGRNFLQNTPPGRSARLATSIQTAQSISPLLGGVHTASTTRLTAGERLEAAAIVVTESQSHHWHARLATA